MKMTKSPELCLNCAVPTEVIRERRLVPVGRRRVIVDDEWMKCAACGEEFYTPAQAEQLHRRSIEQVRLEDGLLPPAEIKRIRTTLGLTQREFEELLGTGEKTCVRWEAGRVCQSVAADRLIRLIAANRENVRILAGVSGATIPELSLFEPRRGDYSERGFFTFPEFPDQSPASMTIGGTQESMTRLTDTQELAIITGANLDFPKLIVPNLTSDFGPLSPGGTRGH
jgi:putative zinc finger/helix-turn-helix YgiT family protein